MHWKAILLAVALGLTSATIMATNATAQSSGNSTPRGKALTSSMPRRSPSLSVIPTTPPGQAVKAEVLDLPTKKLPNPPSDTAFPTLDPVLQDTGPSGTAATLGPGFNGLTNLDNATTFGFWVLPPDTIGDIGPNHYVQAVNLTLAIFDRDSGQMLYGPVAINELWKDGDPSNDNQRPCETRNDGDPVVLYDQLADRWLISQFANASNGYYQCIAVSVSPDPGGAWYAYQFLISNTKLQDYPKFGVWPDAYYMAANQFSSGLFWGGQSALAFDRAAMLAGLPANGVYFDLGSSSPGGMLPADWDGEMPPPLGAPNPFVFMDDNDRGATFDQLQLWEFSIDFDDPSCTSANLFCADFVWADTLIPESFNSAVPCSPGARDCIPQRGTTEKVDAIADRLMYRLQYRNFDSHQSMVVNHTVIADDATGRAGIRWYELREEGNGWFIHQEGTYAGDSVGDDLYRWMGSMAMNGQGEIALGYSASSANDFPSIRFTGRLAGDTLDEMTVPEGVLVVGSGSQPHSLSRWGDYSMMSVDPSDDCTFWYTQQYYSDNDPSGSLGVGWRTHIDSFQLANCPSPPDDPPAKNDPPQATDDQYAHELNKKCNNALTISAPGVLRNDSDPNGDPLEANLDPPGSQTGFLSLNPDGSFTYTPGSCSAVTDQFTYWAWEVTGSQPLSTAAIITIDVTARTKGGGKPGDGGGGGGKNCAPDDPRPKCNR